MVQQGVPGDHDPEVLQKARARFTPESEGDVREPAVEPLGPATVVCGEAGQTFREDRPSAGPLVTEEPSDAQANGDRDSLPGQVGQRPRVPGVDPCWIASRIRGNELRRDEVLATRVMAFSVARTPIRFSSLGAGRTVRDSDMGNLDDLLVILGCQLAAPLHRKLGRTAKAGQCHPWEQAAAGFEGLLATSMAGVGV